MAGSESERLIYEKLCSGDPEVESLALRELDQLSKENRIRDENLLGYMVSKSRLKSPLNFRILTRQVTLAGKDSDKATLYKLGLRKAYAEEVTQQTNRDQDFRDEAFLYLKVIKPDTAVNVALRMVKSEGPDEALDSTEQTQFWINVSTTLVTAARTQPSIRRQLYSLMEGKTGIAAARARKTIETATMQEQDTTLGMFRKSNQNPQLEKRKIKRKMASKQERRTTGNKAEQHRAR